MNIAISEVCNQASNTGKDKIEIRSFIPFVSESTVESERTDQSKDEFILFIYRYKHGAGDSKNNNSVI